MRKVSITWRFDFMGVSNVWIFIENNILEK